MIDCPDLLEDSDMRMLGRIVKNAEQHIQGGRNLMALSLLVGVGGYVLAILARQPQMFCNPDTVIAAGALAGTGGLAAARFAAHKTGESQAAVDPLVKLQRDYAYLHAGIHSAERLKDLGIDIESMDFSLALTKVDVDDEPAIDSVLYKRINQVINFIHNGIELAISML